MLRKQGKMRGIVSIIESLNEIENSMVKNLIAGCGLIVIFWSVPVQSALERISDFALLDSNGEFHQLSRYKHRKAVVLMSYVQQCEAMQSLLTQFKAIAKQYEQDDIEFLLIDSLDLGREQLVALNPGFPLLEDDGQLVSEAIGIQHVGDVLVLNPQRLTMYYQGDVGDDLHQTLSAVVQGSIVDTVINATSGCPIAYPQRDLDIENPPDYVSEVAPILIENCTECHRQGGVGPFALDSYIMVLGWSPMIREVLLNKRMPPAQVDPYVGHSNGARYISTRSLQTLIHWIDAGAPRGDSEQDPLQELEVNRHQDWQLGEPDFVVTGPRNEIPPTGVMDYIYDDVELPFAEDRWLRAVQYRAGDESVLHHLMTFVTVPEEGFWGPERNQESVSRRFVEGYAPGKPGAIEFPSGTGVLIPAGHKLSMQFHYVTNGQRTQDITELGLYFSEEPGLTEILTQAVSTRFLLPANDPNYSMQAEHSFEESVEIFGVRARMNNRGKKMKFVVKFPDGSEQELLSVPAYNYGWQPHYLLDKPVTIPAGSTVQVIGAFDNSISNPGNPDPNKTVEFGLNSWDEMFTGYFSYYRKSH